jgi:hypothetical protein
MGFVTNGILAAHRDIAEAKSRLDAFESGGTRE